MPMSFSAFSTFQHGCALIFAHCPEQRSNFTAMRSSFVGGRSSLRREERQVRLALAAQQREIDLDAADAARIRERNRLRLQLLRGEDAAARALRRVLADEAEVPRQLLDGLDRSDA